MSQYLTSDGIGIYQDSDVMYPLSILNGRLVVGNSSNNKQVFYTCNVKIILEEHVFRLVDGGVEEMIQYSQSIGRAGVEALIAQLECGNSSTPPEPAPGSSCGLPLFVEVCNSAPGTDQELVFTDAIPICANGTDAWYTREKIVWDSVATTIVSRETEYSQDGANWTATAPASFTLGYCVIPDLTKLPSITEAFANDLSTLSEGHNFSITKPACCKIKVNTSIGSFHILSGVQFYSSSDFQNTVTINSIEVVGSNCSLEDVHIISNKLF